MNKEKTFFKVENEDDGINISTHGHQTVVKIMAALGMACFIDETDENVIGIDQFIAILKRVHDDKEYLVILNSALELYFKDDDKGLVALAMAVAVATFDDKESTKEKEEVIA